MTCLICSNDFCQLKFNQKTKAILDELKGKPPIDAVEGNVIEPAGRALNHFTGYFHWTFDWSKTYYQEILYMDKLDDIRSMCIEPVGDVAICGVMPGKVVHDPIKETLKRYNPYEHPHMKLILQGSIQGIIDKAYSLGIEIQENGYFTICALCTSLRREIG